MGDAVSNVLTRYQVDAVQAVDETKRLMEVERNLEGQGVSLGRQFANLEKGLMGYRREQTQQQRTAGFLAREFGEFASAAGISSKAMQTLTGLFVEGIAGGLGFGLALGSIKAAVGYFHDLDEAVRKTTEDAKKAADALGEAVAKTQAMEARAKGDELAAARIEANQKLLALDKQRADVARELALAEQDMLAFHILDLGTGKAQQDARRALVEKLRADLLKLNEDVKQSYIVLGTAADTADKGEGERHLKFLEREKERGKVEAEERKKREDAIHKWMEFSREQARKEAADEEEVLRQRGAKYYTWLTDRQRLVEAGGNEELAALRKQRDEELAIVAGNAWAEFEVRAKWKERELKLLDDSARREQAILQHLGVASAKYTGDAIVAFSRLARVKTTDANAEKQRQELIMAGLDALGNAIQDFTKANIDALAKEAAVEGIVNSAKALAALGLGYLGYEPGFAAAKAYGLAAAMDFSVAGVAAGIGAAMGGGGSGGGGGTSPDLGGGPRGGGGTGTGEQGKPPPTINIYFSGRALMTPAEVKRELADLLKETRDSGFTN